MFFHWVLRASDDDCRESADTRWMQDSSRCCCSEHYSNRVLPWFDDTVVPNLDNHGFYPADEFTVHREAESSVVVLIDKMASQRPKHLIVSRDFAIDLPHSA